MALISFMLMLLFIYTGTAVRNIIPPCEPHVFDDKVQLCLSDFNQSMETNGLQDHCAWPAALRIYYQLKICVDDIAKLSRCQSRGPLVDDFFFKVHQMYFSDCGRIQDPPLVTLVFLTVPVTLVALLLPLLYTYFTPHDVSVI